MIAGAAYILTAFATRLLLDITDPFPFLHWLTPD
jgi:hypothetical protein